MSKTYTKAEIVEAVENYAAYYGIEESEVGVDLNCEGDSNRVIGFRLTRDLDGRQRGDDEKIGQWSDSIVDHCDEAMTELASNVVNRCEAECEAELPDLNQPGGATIAQRARRLLDLEAAGQNRLSADDHEFLVEIAGD